MKLKKLVWMLGLTAALMTAAACAKETNTQTQQTQESQETTEDSTEVQEESEAESEENTASEAPVRIFGTIQEVGEESITVDNQSEASSAGEMILQIDPESTVIVDAQTGLPLTLSEVTEGSFEAYLGSTMTMSLPPQTTPYVVIVNIPEDGSAPQYAVAAKALVQEDGYYTLEATDGRTWVIPEDAEIAPFRTKNIVTIEDIKEGSRCLIWLNEQSEAGKVVILEGEA